MDQTPSPFFRALFWSCCYFNRGDTVVQWLALSRHRGFSLWTFHVLYLLGFPPGLKTSSQRPGGAWIWVWLYVFISQPCCEVATWPECTLLPNVSWDRILPIWQDKLWGIMDGWMLLLQPPVMAVKMLGHTKWHIQYQTDVTWLTGNIVC